MRSLRETQLGFTRALFSGVHGPGTPGIRSDGLNPALRLSFYRTNVYGNYLDALRATYRAVERAVGRAHFTALAERFVRDCPSRSGDLNRYGGELGDFLESCPVVHDLPHLADLARLEWLVDEAFYDADHAPLSIDRLMQVAPEDYDRLVFRLHPACRLLRSAYPVRRIWEASHPGFAGAAQLSIDTGGDRVLVRRAGFEVVLDSVATGEFAMLASFRAGVSFACAYTAASELDLQFDPGAFLQRYVGNATLVDFHLPAAAAREESISEA